MNNWKRLFRTRYRIITGSQAGLYIPQNRKWYQFRWWDLYGQTISMPWNRALEVIYFHKHNLTILGEPAHSTVVWQDEDTVKDSDTLPRVPAEPADPIIDERNNISKKTKSTVCGSQGPF